MAAQQSKLVKPRNSFLLFILWLAACSQQDTEQGPAPMMDAKKPQVLVEYCGRCHAPPLPSAHLPKDWPAVITRMQQRMSAKGLQRIPSRQLEQILDYLQRHAPAAG